VNGQGPYRKILLTGLITLILVILVIGITYLFLNRWENHLIQERKTVCEGRARQIARLVEGNGEIQAQIASLLEGDSIRWHHQKGWRITCRTW
jgi:hypothetical protein